MIDPYAYIAMIDPRPELWDNDEWLEEWRSRGRMSVLTWEVRHGLKGAGQIFWRNPGEDVEFLIGENAATPYHTKVDLKFSGNSDETNKMINQWLDQLDLGKPPASPEAPEDAMLGDV